MTTFPALSNESGYGSKYKTFPDPGKVEMILSLIRILSMSAPPLASNKPVKVVCPVTPSVDESVVAPAIPRVPEILTLSSSVVVPPAESIVKLPVEVSISLSLAIPIRILSISAPPLASTSPVNVEIPETES